MFLHLCVILFTVEESCMKSIPVWLKGGLCPQGGLSLGGLYSGGSLSRGSLSRGFSVKGVSVREPSPSPYGKDRVVSVLLECILVSYKNP